MATFISSIPDDCLAKIFDFLKRSDRENCSLVCRRWLAVDARSRRRISLSADVGLDKIAPKILDRFKSISDLTLSCAYSVISISDQTLALIASNFRNLATLRIRGCSNITSAGMFAVADHCRGLRKLSLYYCYVGRKGVAAVIQGCLLLEKLSLSWSDRESKEGPFDWSVVSSPSLRSVSLKMMDIILSWPLILGCPNLKTLKLSYHDACLDTILEEISDRVRGIEEIHLKRVSFSDAGFAAIAEKCRLLCKIRIIGRMPRNNIACTPRSLALIATNCRSLESLSLHNISTFGDADIARIASGCISLKKLCIIYCPVSDQGMRALADGCPNLVQVEVKNCVNVTSDCVKWLRAKREGMLVVDLYNVGVT